MDIQHDEPEPTAEERDPQMRQTVVILLLCLWLAFLGSIALGVVG